MLVVLGVILIALGLLYQAGLLHWVGRLPGDIRWEKGNTKVYVPITTMIIFSLVLSAISYFVRK